MSAGGSWHTRENARRRFASASNAQIQLHKYKLTYQENVRRTFASALFARNFLHKEQSTNPLNQTRASRTFSSTLSISISSIITIIIGLAIVNIIIILGITDQCHLRRPKTKIPLGNKQSILHFGVTRQKSWCLLFYMKVELGAR